MATRRIAVLMSSPGRGGAFRLAKTMAKILRTPHGAGEQAASVVFGNIGQTFRVSDLVDLGDHGVQVRDFSWRVLDAQEAERQAHLLAHRFPFYQGEFTVPDDGGCFFLDCDRWLVVGDRLPACLLPWRSVCMLALDYSQRYVPEVFPLEAYGDPSSQVYAAIRNVRNADYVAVFSPDTRSDLETYAGRLDRILDMEPIVDTSFLHRRYATTVDKALCDVPYIIWPTALSANKNHADALAAIELYYTHFDGTLKILVTGPCIDDLRFDTPKGRRGASWSAPYTERIRDQIAGSKVLRENVIVAGDVDDADYANYLRHARFLFHGSLADNGSYSCIEAVSIGIRALSCDYPQQRYLDRLMGLGMSFYGARDIPDCARKLSEMERSSAQPTIERFEWPNRAAEVRSQLRAWIEDDPPERLVYPLIGKGESGR